MEKHELDLHGVRHHEVDALVENFILMNQNSFPLTVICGNSVRMIRLTEAVIDRIGCSSFVLRFGTILIRGFK